MPAHRLPLFTLPFLALAATGCSDREARTPTAPTVIDQRTGPPSSAAVAFETICQVPRGNRGHERTRRLPARSAEAQLRTTASYAGPCADYGPAAELGGSPVRTYAQIDDAGTPLSLGYTFPADFLDGLPTAPASGEHCLDVNGNGTIELDMECVGGHEAVMELPEAFVDEVESPLGWALLNWNPIGHPPPAIFTVAHFDFHFYIIDLATRNSIDLGTCGLLMDCGDFVTATAPIPPQYMPAGYMSLGAAEAFMGDHLVNLADPVFSGAPFTEVFIYGGWDGSIAFYEPMITHSWLEGVATGANPGGCTALALPLAWEIAGWYPTEYCIRYRANRADYTVSLESWVYRTAG
ncbi:MAG: hypothetical protein PVI57_08295 [Gemmatimonadota bacterium]|jgi:hypothetical protein